MCSRFGYTICTGGTHMVNLNERIKFLRQNSNLTQSQLANRIGVSKSLISAYELGNRLPSYDNLIKIAAYFKVSTDYLLGIDNKNYLDLSGLNDAQKIVLYQLIRTMRK